jgi:ketosteroid isomerase-like protein
MSEENVEIVRNLFQKVGQGENPEALYEILEPDVEFDLSRATNLEMQGVHVGHAAVRAFFRRWAGTWRQWEFGPEEVIGVGDRVVVILREQATGKGSGVTVRSRSGQIWIFRAGKAVRWQVFADPDEALEAAGLQE